jgi:hypothetical protein
MRQGLIVFTIIVVVGTWAFSLGAWALQDTLKQFAGLVMLPALALPFLAAFVGQRINNHAGNPFRGLTFGATGWIFLVWIAGLLLGVFAAVACIAIGLHGFDPTMQSYVTHMVETAESAGTPLPPEARGSLMIGAYSVLIGGPVLGVWFMGAMYCLVTFPLYGWFARRLLAFGRPLTFFVLIVLGLVSTGFAGLLKNPELGELAAWERTLLMLAQSTCYVPLMLWLLLRTRSAVIPALTQASVSMALAGSMPLVAGTAPLLGLPSGLLPSAIILLAGIGLWLWQDPGGKDLVVAGIAYDGTPLTPELVAAERAGTNLLSAAPGPGRLPEPLAGPPAP